MNTEDLRCTCPSNDPPTLCGGKLGYSLRCDDCGRATRPQPSEAVAMQMWQQGKTVRGPLHRVEPPRAQVMSLRVQPAPKPIVTKENRTDGLISMKELAVLAQVNYTTLRAWVTRGFVHPHNKAERKERKPVLFTSQEVERVIAFAQERLGERDREPTLPHVVTGRSQLA